MHPDDPYSSGESDRTVIRPMPGGRRDRLPQREEQSASRPDIPGRHTLPPELFHGRGQNRLLEAAGTLLSLVGQLRDTTSHPDIDTLRAHVEQEVRSFEHAARAEGADTETVSTARYLLCTLTDETVLGTPWGNESIWSEQTLLAKFHQEAWGGEKFFNILEHLLQEPARHIDLLELIYLCLAMGFEGKYRVQEQGDRKLQSIQENLFHTIREIRGEFERELSPHWRGVEDKRNLLVRYVPLWVLGAVLAVLLLAIFVAFRISLNRNAEPVFQQLSTIGRERMPSVPVQQVQAAEPQQPPSNIAVTAPSAPPPPGLARLLAPEVKAGSIAIKDYQDKSLLVIQGDGLFRSGSASVQEKHYALLTRIGEALRQVPGRVLVVGHTDNVPIRSLRFRSNWDLSRQRAVSIAQLLENTTGSPERYSAEGRADTEPLVANDSAANRARNRRVEIFVFKGTGNI
jgi:type VI secretion system protein ImpK